MFVLSYASHLRQFREVRMQLTYTQDISLLHMEEWEELFTFYLSVYPADCKVDKVWDLVRLGRLRTIQAREEVTGKLVGVAHFFPMLNLRLGEICYLETLVTHPERRRCGVGSGLLEEMKRVAKEEGWEVVRWVTKREGNEGARRMYLNFAETSLDVFHMDIK